MKRLAFAAAICLFPALSIAPASAVISAPSDRVAAGASTFGGYLFLSKKLENVSANWAQPAVTCARESAFAGFAVSLGSSNHHLAADVGVAAACRDGLPVYFGWLKIPGAPIRHIGRKIEAGDMLSANLKSQHGRISAELDNTSRDWGTRMSGHVKLKVADAGVGVSERGNGSQALSDFGTAHFTDIRLDGKPIDDQTVLRILMQTIKGVVKAKPSKLTRQGEFSVTWLHK